MFPRENLGNQNVDNINIVIESLQRYEHCSSH